MLCGPSPLSTTCNRVQLARLRPEAGAANARHNSLNPPSPSRTQSSLHGWLSLGMVSTMQSWHSRPTVQGPLLGDTWHLASLVMMYQTIHSDFFNSITRPFGSQMGKRISSCAGQRSSRVQTAAPHENTGLSSCSLPDPRCHGAGTFGQPCCLVIC